MCARVGWGTIRIRRAPIWSVRARAGAFSTSFLSPSLSTMRESALSSAELRAFLVSVLSRGPVFKPDWLARFARFTASGCIGDDPFAEDISRYYFFLWFVFFSLRWVFTLAECFFHSDGKTRHCCQLSMRLRWDVVVNAFNDLMWMRNYSKI